MQTKFIIGILTLVLALAGCATGPGEQSGFTPQRLERSVDAAVGIFAAAKLAKHPQSKPQFLAAKAGLDSLVAQENWDLGAFGEAIASTGTTEISGQDIVVIVQTGIVIIDAVNGRQVDVSEVDYAKAIIVGGQKALTRVLSRK